MTTFQILSDLHLETGVKYPVDTILPRSDILVLAGDIGSFYEPTAIIEFIQEIAPKFKFILYVPGNHEYYFSNKKSVIESHSTLLYNFKKLTSHIKHFHVLDRKIVRINGVVFAGATLWSDPHPHRALPDYMNLDLTSKDYLNMHNRDRKWLNRVSKLDEPIVVITHHAPSKQVLKRSSFVNVYESFYATSLEHTDIFKKAKVWVFGHTHHNVDKIIGNTRIVTNQSGKSADPCSVDTTQIIKIEV
jgi:predicted phosphodiesterase